jgi:hypothetical protein
MRELTPFELWQKKTYGNILPSTETRPMRDISEDGEDERERLAEWIELQIERENLEYSN